MRTNTQSTCKQTVKTNAQRTQKTSHNITHHQPYLPCFGHSRRPPAVPTDFSPLRDDHSKQPSAEECCHPVIIDHAPTTHTTHIKGSVITPVITPVITHSSPPYLHWSWHSRRPPAAPTDISPLRDDHCEQPRAEEC